MFDTLKYAQDLEKAGLAREHAEAITHLLASVVEKDVATKEDLKITEERIMNTINALGGKFELFEKSLIKDIELKFSKIEMRLAVKVATLVVGALGVIMAAMQTLRAA